MAAKVFIYFSYLEKNILMGTKYLGSHFSLVLLINKYVRKKYVCKQSKVLKCMKSLEIILHNRISL